MKILVYMFLIGMLPFVVPTFSAASDAGVLHAIDEYKAENYEEALQLLQQIRGTGERTPLSDYYTGLCQKETGDYNGAVENFTSAIQGEPSEKDAVRELISALVNLERSDEALQWVAWAEKENIHPGEIAFLKGQILVGKKRYQEALTAFHVARAVDGANYQQIDLQIAIISAVTGKIDEASKSLKAIVTRYPGTVAAEFAAEYDQRINAIAAAKRWSLYAGINYLYDDNVSTDSLHERSSGISQNMRVEYDAALGGNWTGNVQYALQNSNYTRMHDYNSLVHGLTLNAIHRTDVLMTSIPLNISHATLDYTNYSLQFAIKPTETIIFSPEHMGQVSVGYTRREMARSPVSSELGRDGNLYNGQLAFIFLFAEGQGMLNLRGELLYEDTDGSEYRNRGGRIGVDALVPLFSGTKLILSAEETWQNYYDSAAGRSDGIFVGSAMINQKVASALYLNLQYSYTGARSTVEAYDYQRNVITTGIEYRY